jgi:hypothetical protein
MESAQYRFYSLQAPSFRTRLTVTAKNMQKQVILYAFLCA